MKISLIKSIEKACIYTEKDIVYKVNEEFIHLCGFSSENIVGKSLRELDVLLRSDAQIWLEHITDTENLYIFTNEDRPKDVIITCKNINEENRKVYYFEENLNSSLDLLSLNIDNFNGDCEEALAIYSYPERIYLKSNKRYIDSLNLMNVNTDDIIGQLDPYPKYLMNVTEESSYFYRKESDIFFI